MMSWAVTALPWFFNSWLWIQVCVFQISSWANCLHIICDFFWCKRLLVWTGKKYLRAKIRFIFFSTLIYHVMFSPRLSVCCNWTMRWTSSASRSSHSRPAAVTCHPPPTPPPSHPATTTTSTVSTTPTHRYQPHVETSVTAQVLRHF